MVEEKALRFSLQHHILPKKIREDEVKCNIEKLAYTLETRFKLPINIELKDKIKFYFRKFMNEAKARCSDKSNQAIHSALKSLANDPNIKICKFDKGRGVVILNSKDYYMKLDSIVSDSTKFTEVVSNAKTHPIISREQTLRKLISECLLKSYGKEFIQGLLPSGSTPGKLYGTIKVHKSNNPTRPIVSMIGSPEYQVAKFLDSIIKPYIPDTYMINSSKELIGKLQQFKFSPEQKLVSYDVSSLFTNVPLQETIDIIIEKIYSNQQKIDPPPIKKEHFKELMTFATQGLFLHKNKLYQQIDGVAMGSPLGPTLANFFMANIETDLFLKQLDCQPKFYVRYVDDILAVFDADTDCSEFLKILNNQHKNLKFTMEKSTGAFPFLDVEIKINQNTFDSQIWRKPTNTGVFLNFSAICPQNWKTGLIFCLLHRAKIICSSNFAFWNEVKILKSKFLANGYPSSFFDRTVRNFFTTRTIENENTEERKAIIRIPYLGKPSHYLARNLSRLINANMTNTVKIIPVYKTFKVGNYFNLKSSTPLPLMSNVVYRFSCLRDADMTYIGMSARHLITRAKEHLALNSVSRKSAVKDHILNCENCLNLDHVLSPFSIIKKCNSEYDTKIHEALLIKKYKPKLNRQLHANGSSFLLKIF